MNKNKPTKNNCIDIDGNVYKTVKIGNQCWMSENLKVTHYRNGDPIPHLIDEDWTSTVTGAYCVYDNNPSNADTYGNLYNWWAVVEPRGLAPEGWHVPTDKEIKELEMYLGMSQSQADDIDFRGTNKGSKLAGGYELWSSGLGNGYLSMIWDNPEFDTSGFSFPSGGYRNYIYGHFVDMGLTGIFWSSTEYGDYNAWNRFLCSYTTSISRCDYDRRSGCSVRCVRD